MTPRRFTVTRVDRYLLRRMAPRMAVALLVTLLALMLDRVLRLIDLVATQGAPLELVVGMALNLVPHYLGLAVTAVEAMLQAAVGYEKINYLMLMMVDVDVHFHVFPRYHGEKTHLRLTVADAGWPGPPRLDAFVEPGPDAAAALISHLQAHWPG